MKIRLNTAVAGQNFAHQAGEIVDWPNDEEALRYVRAGMAVRVDKDGKPIAERASRAEGETR